LSAHPAKGAAASWRFHFIRLHHYVHATVIK
jgi:hypothetical protein